MEKAVLASGRTNFLNITLTASGGSAALKGHVAHFSNASPVVSYARTVAMAAEWSAATAAVVLLACASCARRSIEGEAGFPVMPVPVDNFRGLLADAGRAHAVARRRARVRGAAGAARCRAPRPSA